MHSLLFPSQKPHRGACCNPSLASKAHIRPDSALQSSARLLGLLSQLLRTGSPRVEINSGWDLGWGHSIPAGKSHLLFVLDEAAASCLPWGCRGWFPVLCLNWSCPCWPEGRAVTWNSQNPHQGTSPNTLFCLYRGQRRMGMSPFLRRVGDPIFGARRPRF